MTPRGRVGDVQAPGVMSRAPGGRRLPCPLASCTHGPSAPIHCAPNGQQSRPPAGVTGRTVLPHPKDQALPPRTSGSIRFGKILLANETVLRNLRWEITLGHPSGPEGPHVCPFTREAEGESTHARRTRPVAMDLDGGGRGRAAGDCWRPPGPEEPRTGLPLEPPERVRPCGHRF